MHNLHILVTDATSPEEAYDKVESCIQDWGNENNWRTICGSVSRVGEIHSTNEGRYCPNRVLGADSNSVAFIKDAVGVTQAEKNLNALQGILRGWMTMPQDTTELQQIAADMFSGKPVESFNLYQLKEYVLLQYAKASSPTDNIWGSSFREWELAECGVTQLVDDHAQQLYAVFLDMHS